MDSQAHKTFEEIVLERHPDVQQTVQESESFQSWKEQLPTVEVDDTTFYVRDGDMLRDEAQLAFDWAYQSGLLTEAEVVEAAQEQAEHLTSTGDIDLVDLE